MSPQKSRLISRGRLRGTLREARAGGPPETRASARIGEQPVDDATYYRARLILGDPLEWPLR